MKYGGPYAIAHIPIIIVCHIGIYLEVNQKEKNVKSIKDFLLLEKNLQNRPYLPKSRLYLN